MKEEISNPFVITGYISPDYFCNRINESEKLRKAVSSGRNVTLISLRRMGKTGLLKHFKHQLEKREKDLFRDLCRPVANNDRKRSAYNNGECFDPGKEK
jgi:predicted AAA+ superfamily ATPase